MVIENHSLKSFHNGVNKKLSIYYLHNLTYLTELLGRNMGRIFGDPRKSAGKSILDKSYKYSFLSYIVTDEL